MPPQSGELNIAEYNGSAIMITGIDQGEWIFEAEIVDRAGPILTALVEQVFGKGKDRGAL